MTGPFSGMDPYLEAQGLWESFHAGLVTKSAEALNQRLPEDYVAQIKTRDKIETEVEVRERWIEISALPDLELVTVVEILSPSNKSGSGRSEYLHKRDALIDLTVNLVEIDLLLSGRPMPMGKSLPAGHYLAVVARAANRPDAEVYAWTIRHALPPIPIPLRAPDADVLLDLDQAFDLTYRLGRFNRIVRHGSPLPGNLPLIPADRAWAEGLGR